MTIDQLSDIDAGIIKVEVCGRLRHEDFRQLIAWVHEAVAETGRCRIMFVFGDFHGWDPHSFLDDVKFHVSQCSHVERIAYVGTKSWQEAMVHMSRFFTRSPIEYFDVLEMEAATAWISQI